MIDREKREKKFDQRFQQICQKEVNRNKPTTKKKPIKEANSAVFVEGICPSDVILGECVDSDEE